MAGCSFAKQTDCKKISSKVRVRYFWGKLFTLGNVIGISKTCICINTKFCLPLNSIFELLLPWERTVLDLPVRVSGFTHSNNLLDTMIVDVVNPSKKYSDFFDNFSS
jgi:hypothetical protein